MKAKPQKAIMLNQILDALDIYPLLDAKAELYKFVNANLSICGVVLKVVKCSSFKLHIQINSESSIRKMEAFCVFDEQEAEIGKGLKIKKGSNISLVGKFQACGSTALNLIDCRIIH